MSSTATALTNLYPLQLVVPVQHPTLHTDVALDHLPNCCTPGDDSIVARVFRPSPEATQFTRVLRRQQRRRQSLWTSSHRLPSAPQEPRNYAREITPKMIFHFRICKHTVRSLWPRKHTARSLDNTSYVQLSIQPKTMIGHRFAVLPPRPTYNDSSTGFVRGRCLLGGDRATSLIKFNTLRTYAFLPIISVTIAVTPPN